MQKRLMRRAIAALVFAAGFIIPSQSEAQSGEELRRWIRWCEEEQNGTWNNDPSNPQCYPNTREETSSEGSRKHPAMLPGTLLGGLIGLGHAVNETKDLPSSDPDKANKRLEGFGFGMLGGYLVTGMAVELIAKHTTLPTPLRGLLDGRGAATLSIHATGFRMSIRW